MVESRKNSSDAVRYAGTCADSRAEHCAVVRADLRAEIGAETLIDFGRNQAG